MKTFIPFFVIAICVGMYFLYINPMWTEIGLKRAEKAQYTNILEKVRELKTKRDEISARYNNIPAEDIEMLGKIIPSKFDGASLANDINVMASRYGMNIKEFRTTAPKTETRETGDVAIVDEKYRTIITSFKLSGQYGEFLKFLKDLQSSLHLVDIVNLSIRPVSGTKTGDANLEYSLDVQTYSLR